MTIRLCQAVRFAFAVAGASAFLSLSASGDSARPDFRTAIGTAVAKGHPRLFADADAFARLREDAAKPGLRGLAVRRVRERAEQVLGMKPLERRLTGRRLLHVSREALYRISTLAMAYRLTDERRFLDKAVADLRSVCAFSDWNPSHFLDTGEMSLAVSIGYDWLVADLPEDVRAEVFAGLERNGLRAGEKGGWWAKAHNNWGQVCRAGMIAASLTLADDPRLAGACEKMLRESVEALPVSMKAMAPDGCYPEGTGYWHYGVSFNVFAIAMLESACGSDFGLCGLPGFRETADYPNLVTGPLGLTIGYADCGSSRGAMQALWWFAKKLGRPDLPSEKEVWSWNGTTPAGYAGWLPPVELFWMDGRGLETFPGRLPLVWAPRGMVPIAVLRSGWGKDDAFAGLKGGSPSAPHGHMDGGNFVLDMGGVRWAWELPHEEYNRIEQMKGVSLWDSGQNSGRWTLLRLNTFGHNVPSVDGAQQVAKASAVFTKVVAEPEASAEIDLTSLYPASKRAVRTCTLAKDGKSFRVKDVFEGLKPGAEVRWQFILKAKAKPAGGTLALSEGDRRLDVVRTAPGATEWKVEPAEGPKPLNAPNPGTNVAFFTSRADDSGRVEIDVAFSLRR